MWRWLAYLGAVYLLWSILFWCTAEPLPYVDEVPYINWGWKPLVEDCRYGG